MGILAIAADERVADVSFDQDNLSVRLKDGRTISVPLAWYPRLLQATVEQRRNWQLAGGGYGIHWPDMDEDISTEGLLRGAPAAVVSRIFRTFFQRALVDVEIWKREGPRALPLPAYATAACANRCMFRYRLVPQREAAT